MVNLQNIDLKKEIKRIEKDNPGEERGSNFIQLVAFIKKKEGEEGLQRVYAELNKNGYELPELKKIDNMDWIPSSILNIFLLASGKIFNWQEDDWITLGKSVASNSLMFKLFIRYFLSLKKTFEIGAKNFNKHFSFGKLMIDECDSKKRLLKVRLVGFKYKEPAFHYKIITGSFLKVVEIATGRKVRVEENECTYKNIPCREYIYSW